MPERAVFERFRRELSLDVSVDIHVLLVVEQSSVESQSRGCAKTTILTVNRKSCRFTLAAMYPGTVCEVVFCAPEVLVSDAAVQIRLWDVLEFFCVFFSSLTVSLQSQHLYIIRA